MNNQPGNKLHSPARIGAVKPLALAVALCCAGSAQAFQIKSDGDLTASFDTTISYGVSIRAKAADASLIGIANGGTSRSVNEDDGDRNYTKGKAFANVVKATHELELKYHNLGFFARGAYFYDFENHDRAGLGEQARKRLGSDARMLDAYASGNFSLGDKKLSLRLGQQVVSWGESTFIPNGINVINPVDVSKLRIPGSELKEAFIPSKMLFASQELTKNASVEGFVLGNFDKIKLDPRGSYFSNNDFASDDGWTVFTGFGRRNDLSNPATNPIPPTTAGAGPVARALYGPFDPAAAVWAPRANDRNAKDGGQYGVALRYLAPELNNTEFALYHINYHSRVPLFSGIKGTVTSILTGGPLGTPVGHTGTATYFAEYPENVRLFGLSFNTQGPAGIALQGEYSYRPNLPLQLATPELLLAALGAPNLITGYTQILGAPTGATAAALVPNGTYIKGWRPVKASQLQITGTKSVPNVFGADQLVVVAEVGATKYHDLPRDLKFNGPAVYLPATLLGALAGSANAVQDTGFATDFSWGYRAVGRLEYPNMVFGANMAPRLAWAQDVSGTSGTFNEGVKSASFGVNFEYRKAATVDFSYTTYYGGRTYCGTDAPATAQTSLGGQPASYCSSANPLKDRDFYSVVLTYSF